MTNRPEFASTQFEYLLKGALSKEGTEIREAAVPLSCVRLFDTNMMSKVLKATKPGIYKSWNIADFGDLLYKFRNSGLLVREKGYAVDSAVRHLVSEHLRYNEPKMFTKANLAALEVYREWLSRPVDSRSLYVVEELFHVANLDPQADLTGLLKGRLEEYPRWYRDTIEHQIQVDNLGQLLRDDIELESLTSSLPEMMELVKKYKP